MGSSLHGKAFPKPEDIKLIISDVDGTLLDSTHQLPPPLLSSIAHIRTTRPDFPIVIASGKQKPSVDFIRKGFNLPDNFPAAHCQGAAIYVGPNLGLATDALTSLPADLTVELLQGEHMRNKSCFAFTHDAVYNINHDPVPERAREWTALSRKYDTNVIEISDPEKRSDMINDIAQGRLTILKITLCSDLDDAEAIMSAVSGKYPASQLKVTRAIANMPEFCPPNVNKAIALDYILSYLSKNTNQNISLENVIAFGDGDNDVEMLRAVGYGVALKNGSEMALNASDFVTSATNDEGGVGLFLDAIFRPIPN